MKKTICISIIYALGVIFHANIVNAEENIIVDKQGLKVNAQDIELLLKPAPINAQLHLVQDKDRFLQKVEELYLTKAISEQSKQSPLTLEEQGELDNLLGMFYFQRKIKALTNENFPDFEPLAKLQYDAKKSEFINPERVAVEHILIDINKHKEKDALKIANDLITQLKKGADFASLAEKYSDDPSAKNNKGKLGLFGKGQMIKEFEDAAYALTLNEISKPVKTSFGYHVLRKYDHKPAGQKEYSEVKDELIAKVKKEYIQARLDEFYEKVKKDNEMQLNENLIDTYLKEKKKDLEIKVKEAYEKTSGK